MIEWLVQQGQQVFVISWRNPDVEQGHFDLDTYTAAVLEARDAVAAITRQPAVHLNGGLLGRDHQRRRARPSRGRGPPRRDRQPHACSWRRSTTSAPAPPRRSTGREVAAAASPSPPGAATSTAAGAQRRLHVAAAERPGLELRRQQLPARQGAAGVRRPVTGTRTRCDSPPACTATSSSSRWRTRSRRPAALEVLGSGVDLGAVELDSYVVAGSTDHIIPWENAYRSTQLLGGSIAVRALHQRPHPGARQPAGGSRAAPATGSPTSNPRRREAWTDGAATLTGQLVDRLQRVARRALGRAQAGTQAPGPRRLQGAGQGARQLRPRALRGNSK